MLNCRCLRTHTLFKFLEKWFLYLSIVRHTVTMLLQYEYGYYSKSE